MSRVESIDRYPKRNRRVNCKITTGRGHAREFRFQSRTLLLDKARPGRSRSGSPCAQEIMTDSLRFLFSFGFTVRSDWPGSCCHYRCQWSSVGRNRPHGELADEKFIIDRREPFSRAIHPSQWLTRFFLGSVPHRSSLWCFLFSYSFSALPIIVLDAARGAARGGDTIFPPRKLFEQYLPAPRSPKLLFARRFSVDDFSRPPTSAPRPAKDSFPAGASRKLAQQRTDCTAENRFGGIEEL